MMCPNHTQRTCANMNMTFILFFSYIFITQMSCLNQQLWKILRDYQHKINLIWSKKHNVCTWTLAARMKYCKIFILSKVKNKEDLMAFLIQQKSFVLFLYNIYLIFVYLISYLQVNFLIHNITDIKNKKK